ncbi:hypothetical protein Goarm_013523 [Gossypium armourianum]|uniref:Uncharacterized protein n=1 Tax=Gossypium armourianum TaxID=34283 RepID=A0A7J9J3G8_9ROSI|nr:hypothetical protein [Gossypium armourianum]
MAENNNQLQERNMRRC